MKDVSVRNLSPRVLAMNVGHDHTKKCTIDECPSGTLRESAARFTVTVNLILLSGTVHALA